jgi:hypothetical protein
MGLVLNHIQYEEILPTRQQIKPRLFAEAFIVFNLSLIN